jgi:hypothetical protein
MARRFLTGIGKTSVALPLLFLMMSCGNGQSGSVSAATGAPPKPIDARVVPPTTIGMNLGIISPSGVEESFTDLVQAHGGLWLVTDHGWKTNPEAGIQVDATGHPVNIPRGTTLIVSLYQDARFPIQSIDCRMSAGWSVSLFGDGRKFGSDTAFTIDIVPKPGATLRPPVLMVKATSDQSNLKELSCKPAKSGSAVFMPIFLENLKPFRVLRFMDWMKTNDAPAVDWPDRPAPAEFNQSTKGVAVEYMVALANEEHADPWFTLPFDATPEYYRQFALYVRDHLAKDRKVYVELSNEVWNTSFKQSRDATARGKSDYPDAKDYMAADYNYADRVRALMAIWSEVFADQKQRLVRVASAQAVWADRADAILGHKDTWRSVDMLATAPYFGTSGFEIPIDDPKARTDMLFANGPATIDKVIQQAKASKAIAAKYGLRYGTYEGGPSYTNGMPERQKQLNEMSRDPRMYDLYTLFLTRWQKEIGGLFMAFDSVGSYGQWGAWGHKEYLTQPLSEAPKMRALMNFTSPRQ